MKHIFVLFLALHLFFGGIQAQKKVAYVIYDRISDVGAWPVNNDVIVKLLKTDSNFKVTVFSCTEDGIDDSTGELLDLTGFDAIIAQDAIGSQSKIWKEGFPLYIGSLPIPTIYNKLYSLKAGRGLTTGEGATVEIRDVLNLTVVQPEHEIFNGIDVSSGKIKIVKSGVSDFGSTGNKAMHYNIGNVVTGVTSLGYPEGAVDPVLALNDCVAGSTIDGITIPVRMLTFNMNYGQFLYKGEDEAGTNLTEAGLTIWRNAVCIICGLPVPNTPASFDSTTEVSSRKMDKINAYAVPGGIRISATNSDVSVYSISGLCIAKVRGASFVAVKPGVYVVIENNSAAKITVFR